jgi:hypothetical protein
VGAIKKIVKWVGIVVGSLVGLLVVAVVFLILLGSMRVNKAYEIQLASIPIPTDAVAIERGRHFVETVGLCSECHGDQLQGDIIEEDPVFGTIAPPNLTSGAGVLLGS